MKPDSYRLFHLDPWTLSKLHFGHYLFTPNPPNILSFQVCHWIFPKYRFHPLNFNLSYLFNRNSESGDSCTKILRITSSFSLSYSYSYNCCICVIVWLSIRGIHSATDIWRLPRWSIKGFQDQVYEDSVLSFLKQWGKCPWRMLYLFTVSIYRIVLDACCTYLLYLSIGLHARNLWRNCGNTYVSYLSMYYPCYPGFG
jgi:hypothetical protein